MEETSFKTVGKVVNTIAGKVASRKLLVWIAASTAFFMGKIDADMWSYISLAYIGSQALIDGFKK